MELINGERGTGKTTALEWVAGLTGYPLIVHTAAAKKMAIQRKKELQNIGAKDFNVYTLEEWKYCSCGHGYQKVLIDDLNIMLPIILKDYLGVEVQAATMCVPMKELKKGE